MTAGVSVDRQGQCCSDGLLEIIEKTTTSSFLGLESTVVDITSTQNITSEYIEASSEAVSTTTELKSTSLFTINSSFDLPGFNNDLQNRMSRIEILNISFTQTSSNISLTNITFSNSLSNLLKTP